MKQIEILYRDWSIATNPLNLEIETHLYGNWNDPKQPLYQFQHQRKKRMR